ncbi:MAG: NHLP leader peptide family RiPP precursor [Candidatus Nanopelagicales bacterium]
MDYFEWQVKAATDAEFRERLLADPKSVLAECGIEIPAGVAVRVAESTTEELVLTIPPLLPAGAELDEDALSETAAGSTPLCIGATVISGVTLGYLVFSNQGSSEPIPQLKLRLRR